MTTKRCHCCQKELSTDMFGRGRVTCRPCLRSKAKKQVKQVKVL